MREKNLIFVLVLTILLSAFCPMNVFSFELKYLHAAGSDINYSLEIDKNGQQIMLDMNRHIDSNDGTNIEITTSFSNARVENGGITTPLSQVNGQVSTTIMDDHGVVSSITPLSSFNSSATTLGLSLQRDIINTLGVSSFPASDIDVGDSWTKTASKGTTNAIFTYTVAQKNLSESGYSSVVQVDISSNFEIDEQIDTPMAKKTSYVKGQIAVNGSLFFDIDTGRIVKIVQNVGYTTLNILVDYNGIPSIVPDDGVMASTLLIQ